jgi:hypothetical protein
MKKAALLTFVLCAIALAAWTEVPVWYYDGVNYTPQQGLTNARGRGWMDGAMSDSCNKQSWVIPCTDSLSMAQWFFISTTGTAGWWKIRKPGTFYMRGPATVIKSNYDIQITYTDLQNLVKVPPDGVNNTITRWVAFYDDTLMQYPWEVPEVYWFAAPDAPGMGWDTYIEDYAGLHEGRCSRMWEKIIVENCNSAGEYHDPNGFTATITLQLIQPWIDEITGLYEDPQP